MLPQHPAAFLFDLNGTMIDDMNYHITAWHRILNDLGATLTLEKMKEECYGKNNELLERMFPGRFTETQKNQMSLEKEKKYQEQFRPHLKLLPGLDKFLQSSKEHQLKMGIGSAAILFNIDFVIDNLSIRHYFDVLISADDVLNSKPDPETYLRCSEALGVSPKDCIVFEDSPKGVESAQRAGMPAIVITLLHEEFEFSDYSNILFFIKDYTDPKLPGLLTT